MKKIIILLILVVFVQCFSQAQVWITSFETAKTLALAENKLILVDFYADWCGPCKTMDIETWNQADVKEQMLKVVAAKINIDINLSIATEYNVKAIPNILIIDGYGNVLHRELGYKSKEEMLRLLSGFPDNIEELSLPLSNANDDPKNPDALFDVALNFQKIAKKLEGKGQDVFIGESNSYFSKAKRIYKKAKKTEKTECIELLKCYNKVILGQTKSAMKELEKTGFENFQECNLALCYYVAINCFIDMEEVEKAKSYFEKLKTSTNSSEYVTEIERSFSEIVQG